ncbi:hypothetical protein [Bifidobacterium myosotis]|uniref:Uncharacterized protein n=1 Tax=Bifidobacterium myosotis TaxID=1630166 RepID=A0A5M9ZFN6_9BIFI|nr:hypothetical protein [Bifidobacterium myosotis]KAA8825097.1 hypothetical protein EMO91_12780 [Bifidobacterium myosotis]
MDDVIIDDDGTPDGIPFDMDIGAVRTPPRGRGRRFAPSRPSAAGLRALAALPVRDAGMDGRRHRTLLLLARGGLAERVDGVWSATPSGRDALRAAGAGGWLQRAA